jgi:hypothetical protein
LRDLVNTIMNFRVPKMLGISWVGAQLAASQEGISSMKLVIMHTHLNRHAFNSNFTLHAVNCCNHVHVSMTPGRKNIEAVQCSKRMDGFLAPASELSLENSKGLRHVLKRTMATFPFGISIIQKFTLRH